MATTTKTKAKPPSVIKRVDRFDPSNQDTFQQQELPAYTPSTTPTSSLATGDPAGKIGVQGVPGVPQSFVDDLSGDISKSVGGAQPNDVGFSYLGATYKLSLNPDGSINPDTFTAAIQRAWNATPPEKKASYQQRDSTNVTGQNQQQLQGIATQQALGAPAQNAAVANQLWQPVQAAQNRAVAAQGAQVTGDRANEQELNGRIGEYTGKINQNQTDRMADIGKTNAFDTQLGDDFYNETMKTNASNSALANRYTDAANETNAKQTAGFDQFSGQMAGINQNQTGLFNDFSGQMAGINANQTGLYNNFMGDISSANGQQNQNLSQFGGAVTSANNTQNATVAQYSKELAAMNKQDQAAYLQFISETNPLMAQQIAQASNPQYVANQENAVQQFKNNYNPEVTGQERLLAELARRKFEGDDQSSRQAQMAQLDARGLHSGGLTIAGQQQSAQQLSQDRMMNELGLSANAVGRAQQNREDYSTASNSLRNADDAMKNFQDQYAQNDSIRRGNLAVNRNQQSLATTRQVTDRDSANYQAKTQSNNLNYDRNRDYYDASTQTVNNNFARTQAGYDAGSQTNRDNADRDLGVFNAGTDTNTGNERRDQAVFNGLGETNRDNWQRTSDEVGGQATTNQTNLGNFGNTVSGPSGRQTINDANSARYQGGLDKGDLGAGSILGAQSGGIAFKTGNLASEAQNATNWVPTASQTAQTGIGIQKGITQEGADALNQLLGFGVDKQAQDAVKDLSR